MPSSARPRGHGRLRRVLGCVLLPGLLTGANAHAEAPERLPEPLRLDQVIDYARAHRAEIAASRARARAVAERPAIVTALEDPMVSPSIDHLPFRGMGVDASLQLEQRFPLSRIRGNRRRAAEADAARARADTDRVFLDVELEAANAFLMLHERRQMVRILEAQKKLADQVVSAALARYSTGNGTQSDALRSQIEVSRLDGALRSNRAEVRAAEAMLNTGLGRSAELPVPALDPGVATSAPPSVEVVRMGALDGRPELRAGRAEVQRAQAEVSVMESMYWPMAMVRTGPAYTMAEGAGWMLMFGVSVPIWRDRLRSGVAEAESMVEMSRADLVAMRRMVEGDAVASREQVIAARERFLALRDEVVPRAEQAIAPTLAGYTSGQLPLVSVLEAAQALWSAQTELVSAEVALGLAWARLRRATGQKEGAKP